MAQATGTVDIQIHFDPSIQVGETVILFKRGGKIDLVVYIYF